MQLVDPQPHPLGQQPATLPGQKYLPGPHRWSTFWIRESSGDRRLPDGASVKAATTDKPMVKKTPSASASFFMAKSLI
jgi:hypothetical protein